MRGNVPEEDGVDHRVEPQLWLADGAADGADTDREEDQSYPAEEEAPPYAAGPAYPADAAYHADPTYPAESVSGVGGLGPEHPNGNSADTGSVTGASPPGAEIDMAPPYPAQLPPVLPPARGLGARMMPSFLTRSKSGAAKPAQPPEGERSSEPMTARVTAPFQARPKPGAAKPVRPSKTAAASVAPKAPQSTRKAQLILSRIEPWSVMKFSFMISLVGWVVLFVAVTILYFVLSKLGVFHAIQTTVGSVTSSKDTPGVDARGGWFSASRVLGYTMLVGAVNVILITALATVGSVIYNLVTHIAGGIEVTLKETD